MHGHDEKIWIAVRIFLRPCTPGSPANRGWNDPVTGVAFLYLNSVAFSRLEKLVWELKLAPPSICNSDIVAPQALMA